MKVRKIKNTEDMLILCKMRYLQLYFSGAPLIKNIIILLQKIPEQKLQVFAMGAKRSLTRKEQEDLKKKQEQEAAADVCGKLSKNY